MAKYKKQDIVFFTAYIKNIPNEFYTCKGIVEDSKGDLFKVKITAISTKAIGSKQSNNKQSILLGRPISKKGDDLIKALPKFLEPDEWIIWKNKRA